MKWTYFWWILAIFNHFVAEADMEATLFVFIKFMLTFITINNWKRKLCIFVGQILWNPWSEVILILAGFSHLEPLCVVARPAQSIASTK